MPEPQACTFEPIASDLQVLNDGSEEERAQIIGQRLSEWKSAANAF